MLRYIKISAAVMLLFGLGSCSKDFLEPHITTSKDVGTSVNTVGDLQALVKGAYDRMNESDYYGREYIVFGEVRSDNAFSNENSGRFLSPAQFSLTPTDAYAINTWEQIYQVIANTNIVINTEVENNDSDEVKYVKGQAYTIRALAYMDLLRLYGQQNAGGDLGVPLVTIYNDPNIYPARATIEAVWDQIGSDLEAAVANMKAELDGDSPVEITSLAPVALQTRYYLYIGEYDNVIAAAEKVMDGPYSIVDAASYEASWQADEAANSIFELAFTDTDNLSSNSLTYIYQDTGYGDIEVTDDLYDLYEPGDVRRTLFSVDGDVVRMVGKYQEYQSNVPLIRYEEVILNLAEALAHDSPADALPYLNLITANRNATPYVAATLENVRLERRKELAMEGHRYFDLMRYEQAVPFVDNDQKFDEDIPFGDTRLAFPIPAGEISANPNVEQNKDY